MEVSVKLVVFWNHEQGRYCSYCPELRCVFGKGETVQKVVQIVREDYLLWELRNRFWQINLWRRGWKITENSVIPPIFTDEEAVKRAKEVYGPLIVDHQIVVIHVEVPKAEKRRDLPGFYSPSGTVSDQ
jgi:hypothetical protein